MESVINRMRGLGSLKPLSESCYPVIGLTQPEKHEPRMTRMRANSAGMGRLDLRPPATSAWLATHGAALPSFKSRRNRTVSGGGSVTVMHSRAQRATLGTGCAGTRDKLIPRVIRGSSSDHEMAGGGKPITKSC